MSKLKNTLFILGGLFVVFSILLLSNNAQLLAESEVFEEITNLEFKIDGTYEGDPAVFWIRDKKIGTENEAFRVDITNEADEKFIVILDKGENKVIFKEMGTNNWQELPSMMLSNWWDTWRDEFILPPEGGESFWREIEGREYVTEGNGQTVTIYDVKVDDPIDDSIFNPVG